MLAVEVIRALELAQQIHRSRHSPICRESQLHAGSIGRRHSGSVAVESDVRSRSPHEIRSVRRHGGIVRLAEPNRFDECTLRLDQILPAAR